MTTDAHLIPIGTSPAWANPGEPTSGFLLEADGFRVLVDCGSGVMARYLELFGTSKPIHAVVVTHVHLDHIADLVPLKYGIEYGGLHGWSPELWLPPGVHGRLLRLVSTWDGGEDFFSETFGVRGYAPDRPVEVGPFRMEAHEVPHFINAWALRFGRGDSSFGYTSDLGPSPTIAGFMAGVDLLLCEATLSPTHGEPPYARGHLTAEEAGEIARDAGVRNLLLTHVPDELRGDAIARAASMFDGPIRLAESGHAYPVSHRLARTL
jgi:ribonuclease BN (tRNA processing enzyme)